MNISPESLCGKFISGPELRKRLADVSDMTLWRWQHDPALNFPKPVKIRRRNYYSEDDVTAWWRARSRGSSER